MKKRRIEQTMRSRKKRIPETEIGVGSGKHSKNAPGENNINWKTGIVGYHKMIDLTTACCEQCGSTKNLLIHHRDHDRTNNKRENLQVLCKKCHQKHHTVKDAKTGRYVKVTT